MYEREQYFEKAKAQLDKWNARIDELQAKADGAEADARIEYEKQINELRGKRDEAVVKELREPRCLGRYEDRFRKGLGQRFKRFRNRNVAL
jgi:uncharacterized coiled-coil DUF342 family protein